MKTLIKGILCLIALAHTSCNFKTYSKAYVANAPNVADFRTQDTKLSALLSLTDAELQVALPIDDHFGISFNGLYGFTGQAIGEVGGVYYHNAERLYFEFGLGYGLGRINSEVRGIPHAFIWSPGIPAENYYTHSIRSRYSKLYIQPTFLFKLSELIRMGPTIKMAHVRFADYQYDYFLRSYWSNIGLVEQDEITFQNQSGLNIEPVLNFKMDGGTRYRSSLIFQVGASFTQTVASSSTAQEGTGYTPIYFKSFSHPKQHHFIFNIGYEFYF